MQEALLTLRNLSKSFGKRRVIDNISFDVYGGEVFGFLGPSGAGKTTTIKMVMGFLHPDNGDIIIGGNSLKKHYEKAMGCLGGIVENPEMYKNLSGRTNIEMYARIHGKIPKERIDEVINLVGMSARAHEKVKRYSLGMKQRIGLAQALVHHPKVLILDEPTNGLDPVGIKELRDILKRLAHEEGIAVIVSSHMLSEMELMCDRVGIISGGRFLGVKPIDQLLHASGRSPYRFTVGASAPAAEILKNSKFAEKIVGSTETSVDLDIDETDVPAVTALLAQNGVAVFGIERIEVSLEEAFLNITGGGLDIE